MRPKAVTCFGAHILNTFYVKKIKIYIPKQGHMR